MDHEWFTEQLAPDQVGWDWFSVQLDNRTELMLFELRHKDGSHRSVFLGHDSSISFCSPRSGQTRSNGAFRCRLHVATRAVLRIRNF
jgi:hypothetical protein